MHIRRKENGPPLGSFFLASESSEIIDTGSASLQWRTWCMQKVLPRSPHAPSLRDAPRQGAEGVRRIGLMPTATIPLGMALLLPARSW